MAISTPEIKTENFVSAEEYMEKYAAEGYEWVNGELIKMSPVTYEHDHLVGYLRQLFNAYFALNPIGVILGQPFLMRMDAINSRREPDLQIILKTNPGQLTSTAMLGPADICIEVVSPESVGRDHGNKFQEYEKGGVNEYWIVDPLRDECRFYRLVEKIFVPVYPDENGNYHTPLLPKLTLHVPTLWQDELPDFYAIGDAVKKMFES